MTQDLYHQLRLLHREFDRAMNAADMPSRAVCWVVDRDTYKDIISENGTSIFMSYDPQSGRRGAQEYQYTGWTVGGLPFRIVLTSPLPKEFLGDVPITAVAEREPKLLAIEYCDGWGLRHVIYSKDTDPALIHTPPRPEKQA